MLRGVLAVVALAVASGCGEGDAQPDRQAALVAVSTIQQAFVRGDLELICDRMSRAARSQVARFAHGRPDDCIRDLREALAVAQPEPVRGTRPPPVPTESRLDGGRATVTAAGPAGPFDIPLVEQGGRWLLESFFGMSERTVKEAAATTPRRALPPPPRDQRVSVADSAGLECFPALVDLFPQVDGGCAVAVRGESVRLVMDTPFGRYDFGSCELAFDLRLGPDGGGWASSVRFDSPSINNGCADVDPCASSQGARLPWPGRVRGTDRRIVLDLGVCLDTCAGFFAGRLAIPLVRESGRWRAEADGALAGRSGFSLHGRLDLEPSAIRIEATT